MPTHGTFADLDLLTLTQILCAARRPAALELRCERMHGWLYFEKGRLVHATLDTLAGEPALLALLRWRTGRFQVLEGIYAPSQTLELTWVELAERALKMPPAP